MNAISEAFWNLWPLKSKSSKSTRQKSCFRTRSGTPSEPLIHYLGPWESKMVTLQSILIWEKPGKSALAVISVNLIYWYFALSGIQFFYGISILGLATFLHHQWVYSIWPEISIPSQADQEDWTPVHPSVLSAPEVSRYLEHSWIYAKEQRKRMLQLRKRQPGAFCLALVLCFSLLWLLGHYVSGVNLLYGLLMAVMCGPAFFIYVVPKSVYNRLGSLCSIFYGKDKMGDSCTSIDSDIAEFLPEESSSEVQSALGIPLSDSEIYPEDNTEYQKALSSSSRRSVRGRTKVRTRNSSGSSLTVGLMQEDFPSLEDSLDTVNESDLALPETIPETAVAEPNNEGISFVPTHFEDSSDENEEFAAGLTFRYGSTIHSQINSQPESLNPVVSVVDGIINNVAAGHTASVLASLSEQILSAMSSQVVQEGIREPSETNNSASSSLDEDFELISDDELQ